MRFEWIPLAGAVLNAIKWEWYTNGSYQYGYKYEFCCQKVAPGWMVGNRQGKIYEEENAIWWQFITCPLIYKLLVAGRRIRMHLSQYIISGPPSISFFFLPPAFYTFMLLLFPTFICWFFSSSSSFLLRLYFLSLSLSLSLFFLCVRFFFFSFFKRYLYCMAFFFEKRMIVIVVLCKFVVKKQRQ